MKGYPSHKWMAFPFVLLLAVALLADLSKALFLHPYLVLAGVLCAAAVWFTFRRWKNRKKTQEKQYD